MYHVVIHGDNNPIRCFLNTLRVWWDINDNAFDIPVYDYFDNDNIDRLDNAASFAMRHNKGVFEMDVYYNGQHIHNFGTEE